MQCCWTPSKRPRLNDTRSAAPAAARLVRQAAALPDKTDLISPRIDLIISDVDGTLLTPSQELSAPVQAAVAAAAAAGVPLILATGKARGPWVTEVVPRLSIPMPHIYLQGLLIVDPQAGVIHQQLLQPEVILDALSFAASAGVTLVAYLGDRIVCDATDSHTDRLLFYKEPPPEGIGSLEPHVGELPIQKLIFMADQPRIDEIRPEVEAAFAGRANLTTAISGMLEVLPLGSSKGAGVAWLLDRLGVPPQHCMALGDGENDVEMLQLVGLGVAVGNAGPAARAVAQAVVGSNAQDGVAEAIDRFVLQPRGLGIGVGAAKRAV